MASKVRPRMTKKILGRDDRSMMTKRTMNPYVEYRPVHRPPSNLQQNSSQAQPLGRQLKIHFKNKIFTYYNPSDSGNLRKSSRSTISSMQQLETHDPFMLLQKPGSQRHISVHNCMHIFGYFGSSEGWVHNYALQTKFMIFRSLEIHNAPYLGSFSPCRDFHSYPISHYCHIRYRIQAQ